MLSKYKHFHFERLNCTHSVYTPFLKSSSSREAIGVVVVETAVPLAPDVLAGGCCNPGKLIPSFLSCSMNLERPAIEDEDLNSFPQLTSSSLTRWVTRGSEYDCEGGEGGEDVKIHVCTLVNHETWYFRVTTHLDYRTRM